MKRKIIFRADGGTSIGMGHVVRSVALAEMLKEEFTIVFAIQEPTDNVLKTIHTATETIIHLPFTSDYILDAENFSHYLIKDDIVVLDGYSFKTEYQKMIKEKECKLVCIDDLHDCKMLADVIINHAEGITSTDYSAEVYTKFCLGLDYVLLRKPFLKEKTSLRKINSVKKVFISMGAADINNSTQKFTEALLQLKGIKEIHLMLGSINPNLDKIENLIRENKQLKIVKQFNISAEELTDLLSQCDVSICPASSISLESCAVGIGLVSGYTANNQLGNLKGMEKRKTLINFGDMNLITVDDIKTKFTAITEHPEQLTELIENQSKMIDGKTSERLLKVFKALIT